MIQMNAVQKIADDNLGRLSREQMIDKYLYTEYTNYGRHCVRAFYILPLKNSKYNN